METEHVEPCEDHEKVGQARTSIARAIDDSNQLRNEFLKDQGWIVVESGLHFDQADAERIAGAMRSTSKGKLLAILMEPLRNVEEALEFESSREGLLAFSRRCAHFSYVLSPEDFSFVVVCTTNDYYLVAGPRRFVEAALGNSVDEAWKRFHEFADDESWGDSDKARLLQVLKRCQQNAGPG
jgi:hypothetical protein